MKFETLYERYRSGTATPEEAELVEEELAKYRLLTDYVAEHDELDLPGGRRRGRRGERSAELDRRCGGSGRERSCWPSSSCF